VIVDDRKREWLAGFGIGDGQLKNDRRAIV